jgi:threonine/homoserine/homoserine lactone efflux protein
MIDLHLYLGFVFITVVLGLIPGPNLALIIANSIAHGPRYGLVTVAGTVSAQVIQLIAVSLGLTALLESLGVWFTVLRWLGVIYLLWLGYRQWCHCAPCCLERLLCHSLTRRCCCSLALCFRSSSPARIRRCRR